MRARLIYRMVAVLAIAGLPLFFAGPRDMAAVQATHTRLPIPSRADQAPVRKRFSKLFLRKYGDMNALAAGKFAVDLLRKYKSGGKAHPITRYVALNLSWKLAARSGDPSKLYAALFSLSHNYIVGRWKLRAKAAVAALPHLQPGSWPHRSLMRRCYKWGKGAIDAHDFAAAKTLLRIAMSCANYLQDTRYRKLIPSLAAKLVILQTAYKQELADRQLLKANPIDAAASLRMAIYYWLVDHKADTRAKGDTFARTSGSPLLAAIMKLSGKSDRTAVENGHLGNLWWNLAKTHHLLVYTPWVQQHAVQLYRQVIPNAAIAFSAMIGQGDYRQAVQFMGQTQKAVKRTHDSKMAALALHWKRLLRQALKLHRHYTMALKVLAKTPTDSAANQTVGEYVCFLGGQWKYGLSYLKLAAETGLRSAATMDLANPQKPIEQIALGNKWWSLARHYRGVMTRNIELRSMHWYKLGLMKLPAEADRSLRYRVARLEAQRW